MFGYVNVNRKQLNKDSEKAYQSFYCGLCRQLKSDGGAKCQMLLNYDMTFLIILLSGLYESETAQRDFRCALHPGQKHSALINQFSEYASAMDIALSYHSLMDGYKDDCNTLKGAYAKALEKSYLGVKEKYPDKVAAIEQYIADLTAAEKAKETNIDKVSSFTGQMMAKLFAYDENDIWAKDLSSLGFYLGKYIYTLDAYEDLKKDMSKGNYNPLVHIYKEDPKGYEAYCRLTLTTYMAECAKSFERLPIVEYADILRNIIYSGVWTKYDYLQLKDKKNLEEKHD